jgi:hypothetical protein
MRSYEKQQFGLSNGPSLDDYLKIMQQFQNVQQHFSP